MTKTDRLTASSRVALAAYLHDLGKFAERADMPVEKNRLEDHLQLYCPRHQAGDRTYYTHRHAAYSALALDVIEPYLPELTGDVAPFGSWRSKEVDDSILNAAAMHHKPTTFLQWIIATADRMASGFEREQWDKYNQAEDRSSSGLNHVTSRQLTLFEQLTLGDDKRAITPEGLSFRYPLKPLSPEALFPVKKELCESKDRTKASAEYLALWNGFLGALDRIPASHRQDLTLWLDHFDSLWAGFTHAIPSATAFGTRPDVSLYDHSRSTAALAVALWRYHHDSGHNREAVSANLRTRTGAHGWDESKILLIQGDFFGIQRFIFAGGKETQRKSAKLLRGRSFYVSLLSELAALKTLEELDLPPISQVLNAAGKFLIVAPNTQEVRLSLEKVRTELNQWFIDNCFGVAGVGLVWQEACPNQFIEGGASKAGFAALMADLFEQLELAKYQHLGLCGETGLSSVMAMDSPKGPCVVNETLPGNPDFPAGEDASSGFYHALSRDQLTVGHFLARDGYSRMAISREALSRGEAALKLSIFGYHCLFTGSEEDSGRFGPEIRSGNLRRLYDFSLPKGQMDTLLFNGYARRAINGYVARFSEHESHHLNYERGRYASLKQSDLDLIEQEFQVKTLNHLACEALLPTDASLSQWKGVPALISLKGDIDDLGALFQQGLQPATFAKMAALSRQINAFFTVYLPWLCHSDETFRNTYTVFAGGDDFFLIGPWRQTLQLAQRMQKDFHRYVAHNAGIHFSIGLYLHKAGGPITQIAEQTEHMLEQAKRREGKNSITLLGESLHWADLTILLDLRERLASFDETLRFPTAFLYSLLQISEMAEKARGQGALPHATLWRSKLAYMLRRYAERHRNRLDSQEIKTEELTMKLIQFFEQPIREHGGRYRLPLTLHLYQERLQGKAGE
ncbi:MAG: type III-A CRISPR-associated protein Cas10/Csm1 [Hahellaceae bacterium]|nr:type III-A CRISPR-associated protein Cas10/Csm1 [Hahellaceae bacterium]